VVLVTLPSPSRSKTDDFFGTVTGAAAASFGGGITLRLSSSTSAYQASSSITLPVSVFTILIFLGGDGFCTAGCGGFLTGSGTGSGVVTTVSSFDKISFRCLVAAI